MPNAPTSKVISSASDARVTIVRFRERVVDALAAACMVAGTGLFLLARQSLTSLANGTYLLPVGTTYVSRADFHSAQSTFGLWLAAAGLALAIGAAMSHSRARRGGNRRGLASAEAR